ncbi:ligand-binding protein SH3 [candidate division KSB1 bacterium]|nr:MAG: ligand-binding protein SH3 [candidate division KSB1 bacterium]
MPKEVVTMFLAMVPILELRGAIPWALSPLPVGGGLEWYQAYFFAVIGNTIPVVPLLLGFDWAYNKLKGIPLFNRFFDWLFRRTRKRSAVIEKYEALGLLLFVAILLLVTGAWTGTVAAFIFGIRFRLAFPAIVGGILVAGVVVSLVSLGVIGFWKII